MDGMVHTCGETWHHQTWDAPQSTDAATQAKRLGDHGV